MERLNKLKERLEKIGYTANLLGTPINSLALVL